MVTLSIKCANCGARLQYEEGVTTIECPFCESALKIVQVANEPTRTEVNGAAGVGIGKRVENFLKRGYLFLEDQDFAKAGEYFEKCLDLEAEEDRAYIGLVLVKLRLTKENQLAYVDDVRDSHKEFEKALRFAPEDRKQRYEEYIRLSEVRKAERLRQAEEQEAERQRLEQEEKERQALEREQKRQQMLYEAEQRRLQENLEWQEKKELWRRQREQQEARRLANMRRLKLALLIVVPLLVVALIYQIFFKPGILTDRAEAFVESGNYVAALEIYEGLATSAERRQRIVEIKYEYGQQLIHEEEFKAAETVFKSILPYENSEEYLNQCNLALVSQELATGKKQNALKRVLGMEPTTPQFEEAALLVISHMGERNEYKDLVPLVDELLLIDPMRYEELRNEVYYNTLQTTNKLADKIDLMEALPADYQDIVELRASFAPYERITDYWRKDGFGTLHRFFKDIYFEEDGVYANDGKRNYLIEDGNKIVCSDVYYEFEENKMVETRLLSSSTKYVSYQTVTNYSLYVYEER